MLAAEFKKCAAMRSPPDLFLALVEYDMRMESVSQETLAVAFPLVPSSLIARPNPETLCNSVFDARGPVLLMLRLL